jgi:hypothetical protein
MNRVSAIALLAIASVATGTGAMAQQLGLKANIPFDFSVGNTWMPAGEYSVTSPLEGILELRSDNHSAYVASSQNSYATDSGNKLVFDKYGDQYFLHQVRCSNHDSLNVEIPASKAEKRAREHSIEAYGLPSDDQIMIAAR